MTDTAPTQPEASGLPDSLTARIAMAREGLEARLGKPASLIGIPRQLALRLAGEQAQATGKQLVDAHVAALLDGRLDTVLLMLGDLPVLAMPMPQAVVAAWTWPAPRFMADEGLVEHPDYPTMPFSCFLWDNGRKNQIPDLTRKAHDWAREQCQRPACHIVPALDLAEQARPLTYGPAGMARGLAVEDLAEDEAEAWSQFEAGLEAEKPTILRAIAAEGNYTLMLRNVSPEFIDKAKAALAGLELAVEAAEREGGAVSLTLTPLTIIAR